MVADELPDPTEGIVRAVEALGHSVVAQACGLDDAIKAVEDSTPDVALVGLHVDREHALEMITAVLDRARPAVVALTESEDPDFARRAAERGVFGYVAPVNPAQLEAGIEVAFQRARDYRQLENAFDRRAQIERAKGILMERHSCNAHQAFELLRAHARSERVSLIRVAQAVQLGHRVLGVPEATSERVDTA
jgi:response regulator NasT